jgi:hypothetical protein
MITGCSMSRPGAQRKSNWSDIGDLRKPHAKWRLGSVARWFERVLGLPAGAVTLLRPDGSRARKDKTLGALRMLRELGSDHGFL